MEGILTFKLVTTCFWELNFYACRTVEDEARIYEFPASKTFDVPQHFVCQDEYIEELRVKFYKQELDLEQAKALAEERPTKKSSRATKGE